MPARRVIAALLLLCATACGAARLSPSTPADDPSGELIAGIDSAHFVQATHADGAGKQEKPNWCWAAVSQMILAFDREPVAQRDLVVKLFGAEVDRPADVTQIASVLASDRVAAEAHAFSRPVEKSFAAVNGLLVRELQSRHPVLIGFTNPTGFFSGHAYAVVAARYAQDATGSAVIRELTLIDPLQGNATVTSITAADAAARFRGLVTIHTPLAP